MNFPTLATRWLATAVLLGALGACSAKGPPLPDVPTRGPERPINSDFTLRTLRARTQEHAELVASRAAAREAAQAEFRGLPRRFSRPVDPDTLADLPGNPAVSRIVAVQFDSGATEFLPDNDSGLRLLELIASAQRIEVRGRTDGLGDRANDRRVARARALSARNWLINRGAPHEIITVTYLPGGDPVGDASSEAGRARNRRVEIEFTLPRAPGR